MEVMSKLLSESDRKNNRFEFPTRSLGAFPMPVGENSIRFYAFDMVGQAWELKVSVRNFGNHRKPWMSGQWGLYVRNKGLRKGDKVTLIMHVLEDGIQIYRIKAERHVTMGIWIPVEDWNAANGNN